MRMSKSNRWFVETIMIVAILSSPSTLLAIDNITTGFTLRGLEGVYVKIDNIDFDSRKELVKASLTEDALQIAIERRLDAAGIKVVTDDTFRKSDRVGMLYVHIQILMPEASARYDYTVKGVQIAKPQKDKKYFYRLDIELRQRVFLARDTNIKAVRPTWSIGSMGFRRLERIRADVLGQVDTFAEAFLSENPKS
jgi:hypothetical protein